MAQKSRWEHDRFEVLDVIGMWDWDGWTVDALIDYLGSLPGDAVLRVGSYMERGYGDNTEEITDIRILREK